MRHTLFILCSICIILQACKKDKLVQSLPPALIKAEYVNGKKRYDFFYDNAGKLTKFNYYDYVGRGTLQDVYEWIYNPTGQLIKENRTNALNNALELFTTYSYNELGECIVDTTFAIPRPDRYDTTDLNVRGIASRNEKGYITKMTEAYVRRRTLSVIELMYDSYGNAIEIRVNTPGQPTYIEKREYSNDAALHHPLNFPKPITWGNLFRNISTDKNFCISYINSNKDTILNTIKEKDTKGNITKIIQYDHYHRFSARTNTLTYEYE